MSTPSHVGERAGQALRQASDSAPEVERSSEPNGERAALSSHASNASISSTPVLQEFVDIPAVPAAVGTRDDRPVGVTATPLVPMALEFVEVHEPDATGDRRRAELTAADPHRMLREGEHLVVAADCCRRPTTRRRRRRAAARRRASPSRPRGSSHRAGARCTDRARRCSRLVHKTCATPRRRATSSRYTSSDAETITTSWPSRRCHAIRSRASVVIRGTRELGRRTRGPRLRRRSTDGRASTRVENTLLRDVAIAASGRREREAGRLRRAGRASTATPTDDGGEERDERVAPGQGAVEVERGERARGYHFDDFDQTGSRRNTAVGTCRSADMT